MHVNSHRYTLDDQLKTAPPIPLSNRRATITNAFTNPQPQSEAPTSFLSQAPPPASFRSQPLSKRNSFQSRPRLQRMDAADVENEADNEDSDTRGRGYDEDDRTHSLAQPRPGSAARNNPPTPRGNTASKQRYPPPLQNGPVQNGNMPASPQRNTTKQASKLTPSKDKAYLFTTTSTRSAKNWSSMLEKNLVWNRGSKLEKLCGIVWTQNGGEICRNVFKWVCTEKKYRICVEWGVYFPPTLKMGFFCNRGPCF